MAQRECDPVFRNRQGLPRESLGGEVGERIAAMAPFLREQQIKLIVAFMVQYRECQEIATRRLADPGGLLGSCYRPELGARPGTLCELELAV
jgi:hypothetical protein